MTASMPVFCVVSIFIDDTCIKWRAVFNASDKRDDEFLGIVFFNFVCVWEGVVCVTHCVVI